MKIAYLGPKGTFGQEAVKILYPEATGVPLSSHLHVLEAVNTGEKSEIWKGVVAVENSIDGSVTDVVDYFIHETYKIKVCGEVVIPINQCVFARPGVALQDIQVVISHPKGLGQCANNIHRTFPHARQMTAESTAAAVSKMLEMDIPAAAIASRAADQPGVVIVLENFQDEENNTTRFWVVGRHTPPPTGNDKTSLAFETFTNTPGALLSVLAIFASRGLNLAKIESRPTKKALGGLCLLIRRRSSCSRSYFSGFAQGSKILYSAVPGIWILSPLERSLKEDKR